MKIIVVTGASSGMGREALLQLTDRFAGIEEVWAVARRSDRVEALRGSFTARLRTFSLDLSEPGFVDELKKALETEQPDVKFLVNAAGFGKIGPVESMREEQEAGMLRVNCEALCAVTRAVLPYMSRHSRILNFASAAAFLPQPEFAVYAATKSFVLSYSRALNYELANRDIRVTAVCPGPVRTEFFDIAESSQKMAAYKNLVMADPKKVVKKAIRDSMAGQSISVYGILMKGFLLLAKLLPHEVLLKIVFGRGN